MNKIQVRNHLIETVLSCHTYTPEYERSTRLHAEFVADKLLNSGATVLPKKCIYKASNNMNYILDVVEHRFVNGALVAVVEDHMCRRTTVSMDMFEHGWYEFMPKAIT